MFFLLAIPIAIGSEVAKFFYADLKIILILLICGKTKKGAKNKIFAPLCLCSYKPLNLKSRTGNK